MEDFYWSTAQKVYARCVVIGRTLGEALKLLSYVRDRGYLC